jgi:hypothetical protein
MIKVHVVLATALIGVGGCAPGGAEAGSAGAPEANASEVQTEWSGVTTSGLSVTLRPNAVPLTVGETRFHIAFRTPPTEDLPVSVDLVSPEMPMMGVRRYLAVARGDAFTVDATVPMAGLWQIYVNVGDGADAASFEIEVESAPGEDGHAYDMPSADGGQGHQ